MNDDLNAAQTAAVARAARLQPIHFSGGITERATIETDTARCLRRRRDADLYRDEIVGHEMLAGALTAAVWRPSNQQR